MATTAWETSVRTLYEVRDRLAEMEPSKLDALRLEEEIRSALDGVGRELMRAVLQKADMDDQEILVNGVLHGKVEQRTIDVHTTFGPVPANQTMYGRGRGYALMAPMEKRLGLVETYYTPKCAKVLSHLTAITVRSEALGLLREMGSIKTSEATNHRLPLAVMARYEKERTRIEHHVRQRSQVPQQATKMQVGLDGVMVPMEGEECTPRGRKPKGDPDPPRHERRYGTIEVPGPSAEDAIVGVAWHEASVATLAFFNDDGDHLKTVYVGRMPESHMATLAAVLEQEVLHALTQQPDLSPVMASDGAHGNWAILEDIGSKMPRSAQQRARWLLDIFHVGEHLQDACDAIDGGGTVEAKLRRQGLVETLKAYDNGAARVIRRLEDYRAKTSTQNKWDRLDAVISYLRNNKKRTDYKAALDDKLPIATGPTEAAAKTLVSTRMKRSGARFGQHGGQTILTLRSHLKSDRFDDLFDSVLETYTADIRIAA